MDETRERIADIIKNIDLDKKQRVTKKEKQALCLLEHEVGEIKKAVDKLHLRLWHAASRGDKRSQSVDGALEALTQVRQSIGDTITRHS